MKPTKRPNLVLVLILIAAGSGLASAGQDLTWVETTLPGVPTAYLARSTGHGFAARITAEKLQLRPCRQAQDPIAVATTAGTLQQGWDVTFELRRIGREGAMQPVAPAAVTARDSWAELRRGSLVEWYRKTRHGVWSRASHPSRHHRLGITLSDGVSGVLPPAPVSVVIVVTNHGPYEVDAALVTDTFPALLTDVTWICNDSGCGTCGSSSGSGDLNESVALPAGVSVTSTATGTVDAGASGTLYNTATVVVPTGVVDPESDNNSTTDSIRVWQPLFSDGFETGDTSARSQTVS